MMTSDTPRQAPESSLQSPTIVSLRSDEVLKLGQQIVDELETVHSLDMLGVWMTHYIAESIHAAKTATEEDRSVKSRQCVDAILAIWEHRHRLPNGMRPFEEFEAIFETLQSLDPSHDGPRYFRDARLAARKDEPAPDAARWLKFADGLDHAARILIRHCLARAAESAVDKTRNWVGLAEAAGIDASFEFSAIRIIIGESGLLTSDDLNTVARKEIEERIKLLKDFETIAADVANDLTVQLKDTGVEDTVPPGEEKGS